MGSMSPRPAPEGAATVHNRYIYTGHDDSMEADATFSSLDVQRIFAVVLQDWEHRIVYRCCPPI